MGKFGQNRLLCAESPRPPRRGVACYAPTGLLLESSMTIKISDLELWTHLGITEEEQANEQMILMNLTLECKECNAHRTDEIADTIDYEEVTKLLKKLSHGKRSTLEKFGGDIVDAIVVIPRVNKIKVELVKFMLPGVKEASVLLEIDKEKELEEKKKLLKKIQSYNIRFPGNDGVAYQHSVRR